MKRAKTHDKLGAKAHFAEHLCTEGKRENCQLHWKCKAACREGTSTASSANASISIKMPRNSLTKWKLVYMTKSFCIVV